MQSSAPHPDLRIIPVENILPHEEHDSQRSIPLIESIKNSDHISNPPIVAPIDQDNYVILDGANRYHSLCHLGYKHVLTQVVRYDSNQVELGVWNHVVGGWRQEEFVRHLQELHDVKSSPGWSSGALAEILLKDGLVIGIQGPLHDIYERNRILRQVVRIYQQNARLNRTAASEPAEIWGLYPDAIALVLFPHYSAADIMASAKHQAFLPPGISRHIIDGRVLKINYPLEWLRDETSSIEEKNRHLQIWIQDKLANRGVRYYAEGTYQFDE